eukprot:scaffold36279_cov98-Isochrysis_galbana.AAC.3
MPLLPNHPSGVASACTPAQAKAPDEELGAGGDVGNRLGRRAVHLATGQGRSQSAMQELAQQSGSGAH